MFTTAQLSRLSPVVTDAWERHCFTRMLDAHRKASNGYRAWYEAILKQATGKTTTKELAGARDFGKVLLAFAQEAGDDRLARDLAADEENRNRWVLRMLAVDLSFLRGEEVVWEYVRSIYGQSKLPPGDFDDCPAKMLISLIQMLDTQIRRECHRLDIRPCEIPLRAKANPGRGDEHLIASRSHIARLAIERGLTPESLNSWHNGLLHTAEEQLWAIRNLAAKSSTEDQQSMTFDDSTTQPPF